jgi:hypothetical protein
MELHIGAAARLEPRHAASCSLAAEVTTTLRCSGLHLEDVEPCVIARRVTGSAASFQSHPLFALLSPSSATSTTYKRSFVPKQGAYPRKSPLIQSITVLARTSPPSPSDRHQSEKGRHSHPKTRRPEDAAGRRTPDAKKGGRGGRREGRRGPKWTQTQAGGAPGRTGCCAARAGRALARGGVRCRS